MTQLLTTRPHPASDMKIPASAAQAEPATRHGSVPASTRIRTAPSHTQREVMWLTGAILLAIVATVALVPHNLIDTSIFTWVLAHRTPGMSAVMLGLTNAFTPVDIVIYTFVLALAVGWWRKSWKLWFAMFGGVGVTSVIGQVIKHLIGRTRPDLAYQLVHETDLSFPSGHATGIVALSTAVVLALYFIYGKSARVTALGWALGLLSAVVCFSRVYVAAHWGTDVIAGAALGVSCTIAWFWVTDRVFSR